jgi:hypothetical protein
MVYFITVKYASNTDEGQYVSASPPTPHNNIGSNLVTHCTKKSKTKYGQNSYIQNINKAMQDTHFQEPCTAQSPVTPGTDTQHMNPS